MFFKANMQNLKTKEEHWKETLNILITSILNKGNFTWALIVFPLGATLGQVPIYTLLVELLFQSQKYFVSANVYPFPLHSDKPTDSLNPCSALPYHLFFKGMKGKGFFLLVQKSLDHLPLKKSLFDKGWSSVPLNHSISQSFCLW